MAFKKGNPGGPGRPKGTGRNPEAKAWAEKYGLAFLMRVAEGKETDVNMFGKPCPVGLAKRIECAEYLCDQGLGKASQATEIEGLPENANYTLVIKT